MALDKREYKFLVIEDNPGDFALVEDFIHDEIEAPSITHAESFTAAKTILSERRSKFDIILLDLSLPDQTGEHLIKNIVELALNVPVIVLTGYSDFDFGVKSLSLGVSDYILKDELTSLSLYKSIIYSCERQKANVALKESEKKYSDLFNFSPLPMWIVDLDSRRFLDVNKATVDSYGYSREEFLSMTLMDIRPEEEIAKLESALVEDGEHTQEISHRIVIHKIKNGDLRNVEIQIRPIAYEGKRVSFVVATDITQTLKHINDIEQQNEKLREISWMQSHVIRAPLSRMMGLMSLFKANCDDKEQVMDYLILSANELDEVIKNITEISDNDGEKMHDVGA